MGNNLSSIDELILKSANIPHLEFGWDGEDAEPIDNEIYNFAIEFLKTLYISIENGQFLPRISPCRNNSIDFDWPFDGIDLLINIHLNNKLIPTATYYGTNGINEIRGSFLLENKYIINSDLINFIKGYL
jgi:hypothetical protein